MSERDLPVGDGVERFRQSGADAEHKEQTQNVMRPQSIDRYVIASCRSRKRGFDAEELKAVAKPHRMKRRLKAGDLCQAKYVGDQEGAFRGAARYRERSGFR